MIRGIMQSWWKRGSPWPGIFRRHRDARKRATGCSRVEAYRWADLRTEEQYQAGDPTLPVVEDREDGSLGRIACRLLKTAEGKTASRQVVAEWVARNLKVPWKRITELPDASALSLLEEAKKDPKWFHERYTKPTARSADSGVDADGYTDDDRSTLELLDAFKRSMGQPA